MPTPRLATAGRAGKSARLPMPDWFYRTVARPLLFRLPDRTARGLSLGLLGAITRVPGGVHLVDFLGHMRAAPDLAVTVGGTRYPSPLVLGWRVDPERRATTALARFGVGGLEIHDDPAPGVERTSTGLRETASSGNAHRARHPTEFVVLRRGRDKAGDEHLISPRWNPLARA